MTDDYQPDPLALPKGLLYALPIAIGMDTALCLIVWAIIKVIGG
jgi:hypothetical protein